jgi:EmrB/QacA subfamily drug resistance transporter
LSEPIPAEAPGRSADAPPAAGAQNRTLIFVAALACVFITSIESTIVATAMPTIVAALGEFELLSWVFTSYLLTQAITIPIYGRLSDLYGRKPMLLVGIALFLGGSVLCGFAWSMSSLVLFRIIQGLGAGAIVPVGRTLIGDVYHGADRVRMQGYVSGVFVGAAILGPVVGAFLVAHTIWPMVFWVNIPLGLIAGAILISVLHEKIQRRRHRIDWGGSALICVGTSALMFALAQMAKLGTGATLGLIGLALLVLFLFVLYEQRVAEPLWPMRLWRDPVITSGNLVSLALGMTTIGIAAYLPVYIQGVMGDSAFVSGLTLMAMAAAGPVGAVLVGRIILVASYRTGATAGAVFYIIGSVMMTALDPHSSPIWAAASGLLMGLGIGMNNNTFMVAIQADSGWHERGIATSTFIFSRLLGQSVGAAAFGGIINAYLSEHLSGPGDFVARIMTPELRASLAPEIAQSVMHGFDQALHTVFAILVALSVFVLLIGLILPKGRGIARA